MTGLLELDQVSKSYHRNGAAVFVLENISLSIAAGERVAVLGPNGSGKSTLLRMLLNLDTPTSGCIHSGVSATRPHAIAYMPQDYRSALFPWLRVATNLALHLDHTGAAGALRAWSLSNVHRRQFSDATSAVGVNVSVDKYPYEHSGGEQQAIVLLQCLLQDPELLVADEPFSAIDVHKRQQIFTYLASWLSANRATFVLVSHDLEEALMLCDRAIVLSRGTTGIVADFRYQRPFQMSASEWRNTAAFCALLDNVLTSFDA